MTLIHARKGARRTMPDAVDRHVAARLRLRRVQLGISEGEAAGRLRITLRKLAQVEAGEVPIKADWLDAACGLLGVRISYFFRGLPSLSAQAQIPRAAEIEETIVRERSIRLGASGTAIAGSIGAEVSDVTIARQPVFGYLPLMIMQQRRLVEKHARAAGLGDLRVHYVSFSSGAAVNDGLITGRIQIGASGVPPFLLLWDRTRADIGVRALSGISCLPQFLLTRNPDVRTIADFRDHDRINVAAPRATLPAILLEMASAKAFGVKNFNRLDRLTVGLPQAEGAAQLMSGRGRLTADFVGAPFAYEELDSPGIHLVLRSEDLMGPSTNQILYTTSAFYDENPRTVTAIMAAFEEALALVRKDRRLAGEAFRKVEGVSLQQISRMIGDQSISFSGNPHGLMNFAEFMHDTGSIETMPATWKDLFFRAEAEKLDGD